VFVDPPALATDAMLAEWVLRGVRFTTTLPPKPAVKKK